MSRAQLRSFFALDDAADDNDVGQLETYCQTVDVGRGAGSCNDGELKNLACVLGVFYAFNLVHVY